MQLWLAFPDEIVARANPYDQLRYLEMAGSIVAGEWLGPYDVMTLVRDVGYALWIAAVHATGIPLRIANELLLLGASLLLCGGLRRSGIPAGIAALLFAVLTLQPHAFLVSRDLLPSSFYAALLLISLAGMLFAVTSRVTLIRMVHLGWTALALGLLWVTRPEQPLIALWVLAFGLCDFALARKNQQSTAASLARAGAAVAVFGAGIVLVIGWVSAQNDTHYGVFRTSDYQAPGYEAANRVLVSIAHDNPRRVVPVTSDARRRAYTASPAFAALRPTLEAPSWARGVSCRLDEVCDDIAGGYFRWILREAVASRTDHLSAEALDAGLARVARELSDACDTGALQCRRSVSSFLHPYPETYLPHLIDSLGRVLERMMSGGRARDLAPGRDAVTLDARVRETFDRILNRRVELAHLPIDHIVVQVDASDDAVVAARFDIDGTQSDVHLEALEPGPGTGRRVQFDVQQPVGRPLTRYPVLELDRTSGATTRTPIPRRGETTEVEGVVLATEQWDQPAPVGVAQKRVRRWLWRAHATLIRIAAVAGLLSLFALGIAGARGRRWDTAAVAIALMGFAVASRVGLLALVDASSFPAASTRYIYPTVSLFSGVMILLTHRAWQVYRSR